jgi:hypothetical protein
VPGFSSLHAGPSRRCQNLHFLLPVPTPVYTRVRLGMPNSRPMPGVATYFTE